MKRVGMLCAAMVLALSVSSAAAPDRRGDIAVTGNALTGTKDCKGGKLTVAGNKSTLTVKGCVKVVVMGNMNTLTLTGCRDLEVLGNKNTVAAGQVKSIKAMGNKNTVTYKPLPKKEKTSISNPGTGNTIRAE